MEDAKKMSEENKMKKETFKSAGGIATAEIDILNDDCLIEVLQHLTTIADKIRIERVCKKWQRVSQKSWNNFKSLDFSAKTWGLDENGSVDQLSIRSIDFDKIIRLSGRYLTRINTGLIEFGKICHLLPNIQELQLLDDRKKDCLPTTVETTSQVVISWLISHGKNIRLFNMEWIDTYFNEEDFVRVLREMKELETLHLYNSFPNLDWSGICLLELPFEVIQEIILYKVIQYSDHTILPMMLKKCKKLLTFGIYMNAFIEDYNSDETLKALSSQADTLKNLGWQFDHKNHQSVLLSTISALIHIEKLDVSRTKFVTDEFLEVVSKHCKKLTYLKLYGCFKITDVGISSICNLEKLTYLNIGALSTIKNPPLERLTSLVVLDSSWNYYIQEECLCSFLRNAPQLRALDVSECRSVTNKLLNAAAETDKIRNSNEKLDLYIFDTSINLLLVKKMRHFVNILYMEVLSIAKYGVENPFRNIDEPEVKIT